MTWSAILSKLAAPEVVVRLPAKPALIAAIDRQHERISVVEFRVLGPEFAVQTRSGFHDSFARLAQKACSIAYRDRGRLISRCVRTKCGFDSRRERFRQFFETKKANDPVASFVGIGNANLSSVVS